MKWRIILALAATAIPAFASPALLGRGPLQLESLKVAKLHADSAFVRQANKTMEVTEILLLLLFAKFAYLHIGEALEVYVIGINRRVISVGFVGKHHFKSVGAIFSKHIEVLDPVILVM